MKEVHCLRLRMCTLQLGSGFQLHQPSVHRVVRFLAIYEVESNVHM